MKIKRSWFWRTIYAISGYRRTGLAFDDTGIRLLGSKEQSIPFNQISLFTSQLTIKLVHDQKVSIGGLPKEKLLDFVNSATNGWSLYWGRQFLNHQEQIHALAKVIRRLKSPRKYPAACLVEPFWKQADSLTVNFLKYLKANTYQLMFVMILRR